MYTGKKLLAKSKPFLLLLGIVVVWRVTLFGVAAVADTAVKYQPSFPYASELALYSPYKYVYSWANFDGRHYLTIAEHGYFGFGLIQAFFPIFPGIIACISHISLFHNTLTTALSVNFLLLLLGVFLWWSKGEFLLNVPVTQKQRFAWIAVAVVLLFPTALYFAGVYTESLFFLLSVLALYLGIRRSFILAAVVAGLASATKVAGVLLVPALLFEYTWPYLHTRSFARLKQVKVWLILLAITLIGVSGLVSYSTYLAKTYDDPLYFFHVQSEFGAGRQETLATYPQVVYRSAQILLTARPIDLKYFAYIQEFLVGTVVMALIVASYKVVKPSVWLFSLLLFLLPTLTGSFSSMPRYILGCVSLFLALSYYLHLQKTRYVLLYFFISALWLGVNTILFLQGYWVA